MEKSETNTSSEEEKTRASIYIEKVFLDELKEIAHDERRSLNEQIIVVLKEFAQIYKIKKKEKERKMGISIHFKCSKCRLEGDAALNLITQSILLGDKAKMIVGKCPNIECGGDLLVPHGKYENRDGRYVRIGDYVT